MARANYSLRAIDFVGCRNFPGVFDSRRKQKHFDYYSPASRLAFPRCARCNSGHLSRLHPQARAFYRIRRARFFRFTRFLGFVNPDFSEILVRLGIFDGCARRFHRRIQSELQSAANRLVLRHFARRFGRFDDDFDLVFYLENKTKARLIVSFSSRARAGSARESAPLPAKFASGAREALFSSPLFSNETD